MRHYFILLNILKKPPRLSNAQAYLAIPDFSAYLWDFVDGKPIQNRIRSMSGIPAKTPLAEAISKDLQKRGFRFVGPTIVYAFMQACGLVNDHLVDCHRHEAVKHAAKG
jgi:DNA-3-methyladenine glycosylase I